MARPDAFGAQHATSQGASIIACTTTTQMPQLKIARKVRFMRNVDTIGAGDVDRKTQHPGDRFSPFASRALRSRLACRSLRLKRTCSPGCFAPLRHTPLPDVHLQRL